MRDLTATRSATRADWAELAKAYAAMDLVIAILALIFFALGGHS